MKAGLIYFSAFYKLSTPVIKRSVPAGGTPDGLSDGDVQRISLGLKFSIPGFFWVRTFSQVFFLGWLE